ncbi:MAG: hypothetical protein JO002_13945, partial [Burkholderiaceae bacterium]|nr:hypothetical protein [Burkholderiaceae bacterium]
MLFEADRHSALADTKWNPAQVRAAIESLVADIEHSRLAQGHWPVHPLDHDEPPPRTGFKSLYYGSAGTLWALWYLQQQGAAAIKLDPLAGMQQADHDYQDDPDTGTCVPSYYLGEVGIKLLLWRMNGASAQTANELHAAIQANIPNPTNEALWAAPGTMVAALHLWEATGEARWRTLLAENIEQLWQTWQPEPEHGCSLWTQDLYGHVVQLLGAGHGFAGNVYPLLRGAALLDPARQDMLFARCLETLQATAVFEDGAANWPQGVGTPRPGRTSMLMQ